MGQANVKNIFLVDPKNISLRPLDIKFGLMKNFIQTLDKFLRQFFPKLSDNNVKEGTFVPSQIRKILKDENFDGRWNSAMMEDYCKFLMREAMWSTSIFKKVVYIRFGANIF